MRDECRIGVLCSRAYEGDLSAQEAASRLPACASTVEPSVHFNVEYERLAQPSAHARLASSRRSDSARAAGRGRPGAGFVVVESLPRVSPATGLVSSYAAGKC